MLYAVNEFFPSISSCRTLTSVSTGLFLFAEIKKYSNKRVEAVLHSLSDATWRVFPYC
jgi:hypothetical protein